MTQIINEKLGAWLLVNGNTRDRLADEIGIARPTLASRLKGDSKWGWEEVIKKAGRVGQLLYMLSCAELC